MAIAADIVVVVHFAFVLFVVLGGLLVLKWRSLAWVHVPAVIWGVLIEYAGWICPLTPLEQRLRSATGASYNESFTAHYILPILYPEALTRSLQLVLGTAVLALNAALYAWVLYRYWRDRRR